MKRTILYLFSLLTWLYLDACQTKDPVLPAANGAVAVAKVNTDKAYFDVNNLANAEFEFELRGEDFGRNVPVKAIELWVGLNAPRVTLTSSMTACGNGVGCLYPGAALAPLPSRLVASDKLLRTVTTLPSVVNIKASEMATVAGSSLSALRLNDTFLVKFVVQTQDGRRFDAFHDGICDETRGQVGDCRLVIRVDNKKALYQPLK
ncbi:hypothetical protein [Tellurirhabdus rosea]|uniref:hypothetical protein n=1 Tax=Tellurirhabdus rosea TaxID=2674997 RepID=UPI0022509D19|nr:hypothetical protein [Tellurirhabdus rosea]